MDTMNPALIALAGFAGWTLLLVLIVANFRVFNFIAGAKIPINAFDPGGDDLPGFGRRVTRAHLNCIENLPILAALVAVAGFSGQYGVMEGTVMYVLYARIAQSVTHMISTATLMVWIRATFFFVQIILMAIYAYKLFCGA
ncbi:MAG: MAPEG family protein [Porticoccaceae bacterium]|nr:MAPEG family protein [Porticoccaceae bacterium]